MLPCVLDVRQPVLVLSEVDQEFADSKVGLKMGFPYCYNLTEPFQCFGVMLVRERASGSQQRRTDIVGENLLSGVQR